ncbi:hypothetical protein PUN28_008969 [Cardiocondyla obscurior]|uniref:Uncharacterized protein n=1 Tax=Cardiocondyla obscurior TaxID=286306 RepID=A0AAW2FVK6_9HYME
MQLMNANAALDANHLFPFKICMRRVSIVTLPSFKVNARIISLCARCTAQSSDHLSLSPQPAINVVGRVSSTGAAGSRTSHQLILALRS